MIRECAGERPTTEKSLTLCAALLYFALALQVLFGSKLLADAHVLSSEQPADSASFL